MTTTFNCTVLVRTLIIDRTCAMIDQQAEGNHMQITASKLRENIYRILDHAIETGIPVEVIRKGKVVTIVPEKRASKLSRLKKRNTFKGDPDDIIHMDWSKYWTELK